MTEKTNSKRLPSVLYARHMHPGVARYDDEMILVDVEGMKAMAPSFAGKPVFVGHDSTVAAFMQGSAPDMPEEVDGYVADCFYNEVDGWLWSKIIVTSDRAHEAVRNGWRVSNAYLPTDVSGAGQHLNVDYDRKIVNAEFTHLAIVPDPRYEEAVIMSPDAFKNYQADKRARLNELQNSKKTGANRMFKFFKTEKKEVNELDGDVMVELQNGKSVSLKEIINAVEEAEKENEAEAEKKEMLNMDTEVDVGDKKMPLKELINRYMELSSSAAEDKDDEKSNEAEAEDKEKENEADKKEEEEKQNAKKKNFDELSNANKKKAEVTVIDTAMDKLARGQARYGSK